MFKKLYNKVIIPVIRLILPGITLRKLLAAFMIGLILSVPFYTYVFPRVNNTEWAVFLTGFGAIFTGLLFIRTIAGRINRYLCSRKEIIAAVSKKSNLAK